MALAELDCGPDVNVIIFAEIQASAWERNMEK